MQNIFGRTRTTVFYQQHPQSMAANSRRAAAALASSCCAPKFDLCPIFVFGGKVRACQILIQLDLLRHPLGLYVSIFWRTASGAVALFSSSGGRSHVSAKRQNIYYDDSSNINGSSLLGASFFACVRDLARHCTSSNSTSRHNIDNQQSNCVLEGMPSQSTECRQVF